MTKKTKDAPVDDEIRMRAVMLEGARKRDTEPRDTETVHTSNDFIRVPRILLCDSVVLLTKALPKDPASRFAYEHLIKLLNKALGY
jgi:hypothetical protein